MAIGFVLINTEAGKEHEVYDRLLHVPEIKEMMPLFGEFDLIAKIEADAFDDLGRLVAETIRNVPAVKTTRTLTGTHF